MTRSWLTQRVLAAASPRVEFGHWLQLPEPDPVDERTEMLSWNDCLTAKLHCYPVIMGKINQENQYSKVYQVGKVGSFLVFHLCGPPFQNHTSDWNLAFDFGFFFWLGFFFLKQFTFKASLVHYQTCTIIKTSIDNFKRKLKHTS